MPVAADTDRSELVNVETLDFIAFPLTPHLIEPSASANYSDLGGIGASFVPQIYNSTPGEELTVEFPYYRVGLAHAGGLSVEKATDAMAYHLAFVRSLLVPGTRPDGLSRGAPDLCLLTIPGILAWQCRVRSVRPGMRRGDDLRLLELKMTITFREESARPLSAEDILDLGYMRG